jgi:hypothetical protein
MARLPAPSALGHDIAARYLALGYGMTVIPKVPRSSRAVRPQHSG